MKEILEVLLSTTHGTILLFVIAFSLIALIIWFIWKVFPRLRAIGPVKLDSAKVVVNADNKKNIFLIQKIIGDEYEKFILSEEELNSRINQELKNIQQLALTRAIEHLCLEFGNVYEETAENSLQKMGHILELYLHRDFSIVLFTRLNMLKESSSFLDRTDLEVNNEIQAITDDCIRAMKLKIREYILISDIKLLNKLFDTATNRIRDTVDEAIKNFIRLSKDQQNKILELTKNRTEQITQRLNSLVNNDSTANEDKNGE